MAERPDSSDESAEQKLSIWDRIDQRSSGLNHGRIAEAAVRIADEDGLEALSMRRLADALGVATMALYRYVESKDDILGLMLNLVYGELRLPGGAWREVLSGLAWELRGLHLRHPWAGQVQSITASGFAPNVLLVNECALSALDGLGLELESMMIAFATVMAFVEGMVAEQISMRSYLRRRGFESEEDFARAYPDNFAPYVRWVYARADKYPMLIRQMSSGYAEDYQRSFTVGLECVLDGLAMRFKL